ncbi:dihydrolipoamide acetyltransferase family protein [Phenylobacterium sp.]|uniref:dihydrolipoamide acetyltransferase family protein n=1 Tax=Phenylobacterium sp. TaxID=1871053 RepID=UPI002E30732A|nr:dihydrolipoamide acetyltransferase family protein [Phenylobacterium sp.]HEX4709964.1 dihydrolipoamide acetyltransferase family protein [Phenylobacterium sp.]
MGRYLFRLPDVGEGVAEAEIVAWHVQPGARIQEDQALVDVMTDKATVEMTSPVDGVIVTLHGEMGAMAPVGSVLVEIEVEGAGEAAAAPAAETSVSARPMESAPMAPAPVAQVPMAGPKAAGTRAGQAAAAFATRAPGDAPLASPATRARAHQLGIALQFVAGTGPAGRITPQDLDVYVAGGGQPLSQDARFAAKSGTKDVRILGLRRRIAEKMQEAKRRIPHFGYVEEFDLTELEALRGDLNANRREGQPKLTLLPFFMRALVGVLPDFPQINARYDDEAGVLHMSEGVHVGIATQTPGGLMVPVVTHAEARDLWDCAAELSRVTAAARDGSATRDELTGSTITLTSLGPLGGVAATPVINHPEVAIIGPNKLGERPVVQAGHIVVRKMMNVSSSFDHRIVDGFDAARFVQQLKRRIEHPALLFVD